VEFLPYKLRHMLHRLKKVPWRRTTIKAETCRSINKQNCVQSVGVEFYNDCGCPSVKLHDTEGSPTVTGQLQGPVALTPDGRALDTQWNESRADRTVGLGRLMGMNEWRNECMKEWTDEWMNERKNERTNERRNDWTNTL